MSSKLAVHGGTPVRTAMLPYGRQSIDEHDIQALVEVLRSDWLTSGPGVNDFECAFAELAGAPHAVAVSNGTAALHAAVHALGVKPGDEVIVPPMTFSASANCIVFQGGDPVFADVDPDTLLLDPACVEEKITPRTRAIMAVDYAGQACRYDELREIADRHGLALVADACHALGGTYKDRPVGSLADLSTFSFHPVKPITCGEGGMITTADAELAERMRKFRNHGIDTTPQQRQQQATWYYRMEHLGYNYRLTDLQSALGQSQLKKLAGWVRRRKDIARSYDGALAGISGFAPLGVRDEVSHAYHLYVVRIDPHRIKVGRKEIFTALRAEGIGVNVHYIPVHLLDFYRRRFGTGPGLCPVSEQAYDQMITLPVYPGMGDKDVDDVIAALDKVARAYQA